MTFLFWNRSKIHAHLLPLKVRSPHLELWIDLLNVYLDSCFIFLDLIWFLLNNRHDISVLNHSIIGQHLFTSTQSASPQDWVLNCIYVIYLFIHSLIRIFFYYYLFVSLNLIYINQVWHFCFETFKNTRPFTSTQSASRNLELWIDLFKCIFR